MTAMAKGIYSLNQSLNFTCFTVRRIEESSSTHALCGWPQEPIAVSRILAVTRQATVPSVMVFLTVDICHIVETPNVDR